MADDNARETADAATEIRNLLVRRLAEGCPPSALCAALVLALNDVDGAGHTGMREVVVMMLSDRSICPDLGASNAR